MQTLKLEIDIAGDALIGEGGEAELARLLRLAADKAEAGRNMPATLHDYNGNSVGSMWFEDH